jgi:hypothetical protein
MSSTPSLVLAITATRRAGKDTLYQRLNTLSPRFRRFAAADALKSQLAPFIQEHYGIDVWTAEGEDKELVRPLLISHGMAKRQRDASYWIRKVIEDIDATVALHPDTIPVVSDVRFINECAYLRASYPLAFRMLYLTRDGAPPPTEEEQKHYRDVAALADLTLHWGNDTMEQQLECARRVCADLGVALT